MKAAVQRAIDFAYSIVEWICRIILLFMAVVVAAQVFVRALGSNIKWCEEVTLLLLVYLMFLTMSIGIKEDLHIRIDIFAKHFPKTVRVMLVYLADLVLLFMSACMAYYGVQLAAHASKATLPITGLPQSCVYLMTIVSGVLISIVLVAKLFGMYQTEDTKAFLEGAKEIEEEDK